jgi:hypothetical protein
MRITEAISVDIRAGASAGRRRGMNNAIDNRLVDEAVVRVTGRSSRHPARRATGAKRGASQQTRHRRLAIRVGWI